MASIFEITNEIRELLDSIDPETGEISEEIIEAYGNLQQDLATKQKNTLLYWKNLDAQEVAIDHEIERLKSLKKGKQSQKAQVERLIRYAMDNMGTRKLDFDIAKAQYRSTQRVIVDDEGRLEKNFIKEKVTYSPDKTAIKDAIKAGENVAGAHIEEYDSLSIK